MKFVKSLSLTLLTASLCTFGLPSVAQQQAQSLDELLRLVEEARLAESEEQRAREQAFQQNVNQRQAMLAEIQRLREAEEQISAQLDNQYNENQIIIGQRFDTLQERKGDLTELFGTINGVVNDARSIFEQSLISAQYPGRADYLGELADIMSDDSLLPTIEQLERMWFFLQQEMIESSRVVKFQAQVADPDGTASTQEVVRIGAYNIVSGGNYLNYDPTTKRLSVLPRQPTSPTDYTKT